MNIQVYWDGNVGACEYEDRKGFFTSKPSIPTVTFDTLVYSEDDNVAYDVTVKVGFSGLPTGLSATLTLKKNGTETVATETFTDVTNVVTLNKDQVILSERDKLSCTITFNKVPTSGVIIPARSYLRVDNHGSVLAKRASDFIFNTLANMIFYEGIEAKKPAVVIDTWNNK